MYNVLGGVLSQASQQRSNQTLTISWIVLWRIRAGLLCPCFQKAHRSVHQSLWKIRTENCKLWEFAREEEPEKNENNMESSII